MNKHELVMEKQTAEIRYALSEISDAVNVSNMRDKIHALIKLMDEIVDEFNDQEIFILKERFTDLYERF